MNNQSTRPGLPTVVSIVVLACAFYVVLDVVFGVSLAIGTVMSVATFALLVLAARRGPYQLSIAILTGLSIFTSLTCSLAARYTGSSPLRIDVVLGPWTIFLATVLFSTIAVGYYERRSGPDRFPRLLFAIFLIDWILLSINVAHFQDWILENVLTVPFALLILLTHKWFRLSNISYGLIFAFMVLHIIGTHYTYSEVPFGFWLQGLLGLDRNHYDRIVHFSFGLLMAYPMREIAIRIGNLKGFWALYVPVEFVLAFSAIYEILEWLIAVAFGGDLGIAYLGTQGDVWDAIKDMALAGLGSVVAMTVVLVVLLTLDRRAFIKEFRDSLRVKRRDALGEEAIQRMRTP